MKEAKIEEAWDKKKIIITSLVLFCLVALAVYAFDLYKLNGTNGESPEAKITQSVKGESEIINTDGVKKVVQGKIEEIKEDASNIDVVEIASSSPQVQKIINDIKSLESYPADQAKGMCHKLCDSF